MLFPSSPGLFLPRMAKKNRKKSRPPSRQEIPDNRKWAALGFMVFLVGVLAAVYWATKPEGTSAARSVAPAFGQLIETRTPLSPARFIGKAARAYEVAAEIPKVLDSLFCYCYCKKNHGHKTLLTCFTNDHGSKCDICIGEVLYAYQLYKRGKTLDEIIELVDKKFYRPYRPHRI